MNYDKQLQKLKNEISKLKKENGQLKKLIKKYELQIADYSDIVNEEMTERAEKSPKADLSKKIPKPKNFKEL